MTDLINQAHSGTGDNIAGDKIIQSIHGGDFVISAHEIYYLINISSFREAESYIEVINKLPSKSAEVTQFLEVIIIYLNAIESRLIPTNISVIKSAVRQKTVNFDDLYKSILVEITYINSVDDARTIFDNYVGEGAHYLDNVRYRFFSEANEIQKVFEKELLVLDDLGLLYLTLGLNRVNKVDAALKALSKIEKKNENLEIFRLLLSFNNLVEKIDRPLMYLEKSIVSSFISIAMEFIDLIKDKKELNKNSINLLINLAIKSDFSISNIMDKALDFIEPIREISIEVADVLDKYSVNRAELNPELLDKIKNLKPLTSDDAILILNVLKINQKELRRIVNWVTKCGEIDEDNEFERELLKLILNSFVFKDKLNVQEFEKKLSKFLENKERKIRNVPPFFIIMLCENLFEFKKNQVLSINKLLEIIISKNNYESVIYLYYLYSLLYLEKYESLRHYIEKIDNNDISVDFLILRARYYRSIRDFLSAKIDYIKALEIHQNSINIWVEYILMSLKCDDISETQKILKLIPQDVLKPRAKGIFNLIYLIYSKIDSDFSEKLLGKFFIMEPDFVSPQLCNIHFQLIVQSIELVADITYDDVYEGVIYEVDGERRQKLIVAEEFAKFSYFINIDSHLGCALTEMDLGEERIVSFQNIKLIEKQPSFLTIFQLALEISNENRHNSTNTNFYQLKVSDDVDVNEIKNMLQRFSTENHTEDLISNNEITMYIKGSLFKEHDEFETVLRILENKKSNSCLHNTIGNTKAGKSIILDIYSFVYLCLSNNYKALMNSGINVFITQETADIISKWIEKVTSDDYLSISVKDDTLMKTDVETVKRYLSPFIQALYTLIDYVEVVHPTIIDLPDFANEIRGILSDSVFSTLKLSISNDIPWFCLDSALRTIFVQENHVKVIKNNDFISFLSNFLDFEDRKLALKKWSSTGLYAIYHYKDLIGLAQSKELEDWLLLLNLLNDTPMSFDNNEQALKILSSIIISLMIKLCSHRILQETIILENLIYALFNKCINTLDGAIREDRLIELIFEVINLIDYNSYMLKYFFNLVGKYLAGHFLNVSYICEKLNFSLDEIKY